MLILYLYSVIIIRTRKGLWAHRTETQGRIDITIFFTNLILLISDLFLLVLYILAHNTFMIYVDAISILYHVIIFPVCWKYRSAFVGTASLDVYLHMMFGLISFGWHASFQSWLFAIIVAVFLPAYKKDSYKPTYKLAFIAVGFMIVSFFILSVLIYLIDFKIYTEVNPIIL